MLIGMASCNKFLDKKSDARYVIPRNVEDAQKLLDDVFRMNENTVPNWGDSFTDDFFFSEQRFNSLDEKSRDFYVFKMQEYYGVGNGFGKAYSAIYNTNLVIEILDKITPTVINQKEWNNVMGSALFFRGFYNFNLIINYAEAYYKEGSENLLGIPIRLNSNFNEISKRSNLKESLEQVITDVNNSINLLDNHPLIETRPSKVAGYALLSNVYLYMGDYNLALEFADLALSIKSNLMNYASDSDIVNRNTNTTPFKRFNKETIFYAEASTGGFDNMILNCNIDTALYENYSQNDFRRQLFFNLINGLPEFKGFYTGVNRRFSGLSTNELYLIKAECLAVLGIKDLAILALEELLKNRISNYTTDALNDLDSVDLIKHIRLERRKELIFRNKRFADIKRYNREGENIVIKRTIFGKDYYLEPNSVKYALPLPSDLVDFTGIEQN